MILTSGRHFYNYNNVPDVSGRPSPTNRTDEQKLTNDKWNMIEYESPTLTVTKGTALGWLRKTQ
jgi:hypothetical protein